MPRDERKVVSAKQEKSAAKNLGARQHAGSGSGHRRMDMSTDRELIECKTVLVGNKQITFHTRTLDELVTLAAEADKIPVLHFRLGGRDYVALTETDYLEMRDQT